MSTRENLVKYKEAIDYIYRNTLSEEPQKITAKMLGTTLANYIMKELVKRGIVIKTQLDSTRAFYYQWKKGLPGPTPTLYRSVASAVKATLRDEEGRRAIGRLRGGAESALSSTPPVTLESTTAVQAEEVVNLKEAVDPLNVIHAFSDVELWNELKSRGYSIIEGRLAKIVYLN